MVGGSPGARPSAAPHGPTSPRPVKSSRRTSRPGRRKGARDDAQADRVEDDEEAGGQRDRPRSGRGGVAEGRRRPLPLGRRARARVRRRGGRRRRASRAASGDRGKVVPHAEGCAERRPAGLGRQAGRGGSAMIAGSPSASEVMMTTEPSSTHQTGRRSRGLPVTVSRGRVTKRAWVHQGHKRTAYVFDIAANGQRVRRQYPTRAEAQAALDAFKEELKNPKPATSTLTLGDAVERYLQAKSRKRSLASDKAFLNWFKDYFGAETLLAQVTAARISAWKAERLAATCPKTGRPYSPAAVNRPLAALHHLLKLAHEEWEAIAAVPRIRLEREAEGRVRWLEADEEARLLDACRASRNPWLAGIVTVALETGLRRGELLGLTWDRVDLSRAVIRLELTKNGRRREVPMRQAVYDVLASLPEPRQGKVWKLRDIRTAFENAVEVARLDDFHFHDLRHHFASWFMMNGGQLLALKEILGHRSLRMTERYAHLAPEHLRGEMVRTDRGAQRPEAEVPAGRRKDGARSVATSPSR